MKRITSPEHNSAIALCQTLITEVAHQFDISLDILYSQLLRENTVPEDISRLIQHGQKNERISVKSITEEQDQYLIGTTEVAFRLGIKNQTLRKWICCDKLPEGFPRPRKINGQNKWIRNDVNGYFEKIIVEAK